MNSVYLYEEKLITEICAKARFVKFLGHEVPYVHSHVLMRDVSRGLSGKYHEHDFSVVASENTDDSVTYYLRSTGAFDVKRLASVMGDLQGDQGYVRFTSSEDPTKMLVG